MKNIVKSKIIIFILMLFCILTLLTQTVYAASISDIVSGAHSFEDARKNYTVNGVHSDIEIQAGDLQKMSNAVYNILLVLGIVVAIIIGMAIAIKFMTGSIEEQAKAKESLIPYIAGCVVVFGAFSIWKIVVTVIQSTT